MMPPGRRSCSGDGSRKMTTLTPRGSSIGFDVPGVLLYRSHESAELSIERHL
jgi:hypothetical protein